MSEIIQDKKLHSIFIEINPDTLTELNKSVEEFLLPLTEAGFTYKAIDRVNYLCTRSSIEA